MFYPLRAYSRRSLLSPFGGGMLGSALLVCGLIAVGNLVAPGAVEQALPNWQARFGAMVSLGVLLGFARSVWRLLIPLCAIGFWVVALYSVAGSRIAPHLPAAQMTQSGDAAQAAPSSPVYAPPAMPRRSAIPDDAYFPPSGGKGTGSDLLGAFKLPDFVRRFVR